MRTLARLIALPFATLLLAAAAPPSPETAAPAPRPAIWRLADADTRIYLFGTNHILPAGFAWRSAGLDAVIAEADELVLETADEQFGKPAWLYRAMTLDPPRPILERVDREHRNALEIAIKGLGEPIAVYDRMQTWAVGFMLMAEYFSEEYAAEDGGEPIGVETVLTEVFRDARKPISGVETTPEQIGFFSGLSEEEQRLFVEHLVAGAADQVPPDGEEDTVETLWAAGDIARLGAECDAEETFTPGVREVLLRRRNDAWTQWLIARLERPGTLLFAVGACHLAGADSVQTMLAARGFDATRVE